MVHEPHRDRGSQIAHNSASKVFSEHLHCENCQWAELGKDQIGHYNLAHANREQANKQYHTAVRRGANRGLSIETVGSLRTRK